MTIFDAPLYVFRNGWVPLGAASAPPEPSSENYVFFLGTQPGAVDFSAAGLLPSGATIVSASDVVGLPSLGPIVNGPVEVIFNHALLSGESGLTELVYTSSGVESTAFLSGNILPEDYAAYKTIAQFGGLYELNLAFLSSLKYGAEITAVTFVENPNDITYGGAFGPYAAFNGLDFDTATVTVDWSDLSSDTITIVLVPAPAPSGS